MHVFVKTALNVYLVGVLTLELVNCSNLDRGHEKAVYLRRAGPQNNGQHPDLNTTH